MTDNNQFRTHRALSSKSWRIKNSNKELPIIQRLLLNRGLENLEQQEEFLHPETMTLADPFLMKDMEKALVRINQALDQQERIMIFGDYDVDGVTATAILYKLLTDLGGQVTYRLPHRLEDGYGLSKKAVEEASQLGVKLLITVDCGISCAAEVELANELGVEVIVTDHHQLPEKLPDAAIAIVHPLQPECRYPFKELTGAGVAYRLASALISRHFAIEEQPKVEAKFRDLAMLGTIADCMPLISENRAIVYQGLQQLQKTEWPGLGALKSLCFPKNTGHLDSMNIGYTIAPRLNAAGRIDTPYFALQTILSEKTKAGQFARKLEEINIKRKEVTEQIYREAEQQIQSQLNSQMVLIAKSKGWHPGVVGLVAGRLAEKYSLPVMIMHQEGNELTGSCRGPKTCNWIEALTEQAGQLVKFGGHHQAAGFTISQSNVDQFIKRIQKYFRSKLSGKHDLTDILNVETQVTLEDLNWQLYKEIQSMQPFGPANELPVLCLKNIYLQDVSFIGSDKQHLKARIPMSGKDELDVIGFRFAEFFQKGGRERPVDLAFTFEENVFRNQRKLQLKVVDLKFS